MTREVQAVQPDYTPFSSRQKPLSLENAARFADQEILFEVSREEETKTEEEKILASLDTHVLYIAGERPRWITHCKDVLAHMIEFFSSHAHAR